MLKNTINKIKIIQINAVLLIQKKVSQLPQAHILLNHNYCIKSQNYEVLNHNYEIKSQIYDILGHNSKLKR